ncbi:hypothetical protein Lal_00033530 [Lupinus albus]|nr:hypothetical protein Lal_00033530 [Lupinus albus]
MITPAIGRVPESPGAWFDPNVSCAYHSGVISHSIEHCRALKYKVQNLIDMKQLEFKLTVPDVDRNLLPNHDNHGVNGVEKVQDEAFVWEATDVRTPMKIIFQEMCQRGMVEKLVEDECPDSCEWHGAIGHTLEDCPEFKHLLQKMLDMRLITLERDASLMMAKAMMKKGYQPGEGLRRFSQGRKCIVVPQHNKYRYSLGYKSTQENMGIMTEEKKKSMMTRLGQYEYKAKGMYIPHISRSFVSAGIESRMIAVIGNKALEDSEDYVVQCPPGTILNN